MALVEPNAGALVVEPKGKGAEAGVGADTGGAGVNPKVLPLDAEAPNTVLGNEGNDGVAPNPADDDAANALPAEAAGTPNPNGGMVEGKAEAVVCDAAELEACPNEEGAENRPCAALAFWLPAAAKVTGTAGGIAGVAAEVAKELPKVVNM